MKKLLLLSLLLSSCAPILNLINPKPVPLPADPGGATLTVQAVNNVPTLLLKVGLSKALNTTLTLEGDGLGVNDKTCKSDGSTYKCGPYSVLNVGYTLPFSGILKSARADGYRDDGKPFKVGYLP